MNQAGSGKGNLAIVVSGGPAPGINSVINSCVITACNSGWRVFGFKNGFSAAFEESPSPLQELSITQTTPSAITGGSILGTSRKNPLIQKQSRVKFEHLIQESNIDALIVIGGEGSAYLSWRISKEYPNLCVVHVPKTIDNDLPLPHNTVSFGFETAREHGVQVVQTLRSDAKTCERWFLVETMGREAGFLALGIGISSGATMTFIPEEFEGKEVTPRLLAEKIFKSIQSRAAGGKNYGVVLMAEGILEKLRLDQEENLISCPRDELGRMRYSELELGDLIRPYLSQMISESGIQTAIKIKNLGYELRCAAPNAFDLQYTTMLGYGAVRLALEGSNGTMAIVIDDNLTYLKLDDLVVSGKSGGQVIRSRVVDLKSDFYAVAQKRMIKGPHE